MDVLGDWLSVESLNFTLQEGRRVTATAARMRNHLEYGRLDSALVPPLVCCALGALHIRYAMLWPPCCDAVAAALEYRGQQAWPLALGALAAAQEDLLATGGRGTAAQPQRGVVRDIPAATLHASAPASLQGRAEVQAQAGCEGGCTDASTRLTNLLKALSTAPVSGTEGQSRQWVPLALRYFAAEPRTRSAGVSSEIGSRQWRGCLKEWLAFLAGVPGLGGIYLAGDLQLAVGRLAGDSEPLIQVSCPLCLLITGFLQDFGFLLLHSCSTVARTASLSLSRAPSLCCPHFSSPIRPPTSSPSTLNSSPPINPLTLSMSLHLQSLPFALECRICPSVFQHLAPPPQHTHHRHGVLSTNHYWPLPRLRPSRSSGFTR